MPGHGVGHQRQTTRQFPPNNFRALHPRLKVKIPGRRGPPLRPLRVNTPVPLTHLRRGKPDAPVRALFPVAQPHAPSRDANLVPGVHAGSVDSHVLQRRRSIHILLLAGSLDPRGHQTRARQHSLGARGFGARAAASSLTLCRSLTPLSSLSLASISGLTPLGPAAAKGLEAAGFLSATSCCLLTGTFTPLAYSPTAGLAAPTGRP